MIVLRLFSRFSYVKAVSSRSCFVGVKFRVLKRGVFFEYDIVFDGKRERVS